MTAMTCNEEKYLSILKKELKPAMGCTEPAAAALSGAVARDILGSQPDKIQVFASRDMIKNVMGVGIPNSSYSGLDTAVLVGILYGDASKGLNILSSVSGEDQSELERFRSKERITIELTEGTPPIYIKVNMEKNLESASVTIAGEHDRIVEKTKNGKIIYSISQESERPIETIVFPEDWSIKGIFNFIGEVNEKDGVFLLDAAHTNRTIAEHSLSQPYGMNVGRIMNEELKNGVSTLEEAFKFAAVLSSAASDARMAGCSMPVVINSGSGNQGITATIPPMVLAEYLKTDNTTLIRALCLSHLVAIYLTLQKGRLSALCGVFTAAIGTSCAYVYLLGGTFRQIENVINIMVANLMGIICDGAKKTCALKIYSCVDAAAMSTRLALKDFSVGKEAGILGENSDETISYIEKISHEGMENTDKTILSIMIGKQRA